LRSGFYSRRENVTVLGVVRHAWNQIVEAVNPRFREMPLNLSLAMLCFAATGQSFPEDCGSLRA